jgi:hypothetical protein
MTITLDHAEHKRAAIVGYRRLEASRHLKDRRIARKSILEEIDSSGGELAAAKAIGVPWRGDVNTFKQADVGKRTQVRTTILEHGSLIVRRGDKATDVFVLVIGSIPTYRVAGWMLGRHAKDDDFLRNPGSIERAWFVPQSRLKPIASLTNP